MLFSLGLCTKKAELRLETGTGSSATGSVILGNLFFNPHYLTTRETNKIVVTDIAAPDQKVVSAQGSIQHAER